MLLALAHEFLHGKTDDIPPEIDKMVVYRPNSAHWSDCADGQLEGRSEVPPESESGSRIASIGVHVAVDGTAAGPCMFLSRGECL